jgi:hypothetical protein
MDSTRNKYRKNFKMGVYIGELEALKENSSTRKKADDGKIEDF